MSGMSGRRLKKPPSYKEEGKEEKPASEVDEKPPNPVGTEEETNRSFDKKPLNRSGKLKGKTEREID